jgi:hypothetical protein
LLSKAAIELNLPERAANDPKRTTFAMYISELTPTVYRFKKILIIYTSKFEFKLGLK